ncbi:MAG: 4-hydroxy-3-methylbut-2-enyl diphosphate reductase [Oscillospiraceae bacterium]|nr:4-hydroxy-3-methylbut-2-enyl diphosphate reductase [Oscillospiraceae bacterium]
MVLKMKESGFCAGVRNAALKAGLRHGDILAGKQVYLYGNLVNNAHVMKTFLDKGFRVTDDIDAIPDGSIAVIRAHGVPRSVYESLHKKNAVIEDCTCVRVKKVHEIVGARNADGYKILVIGKANHPEVTGTVGWCTDGPAYVVEKESDLGGIDLSGKICVVAQTTCGRALFSSISNLILEKNPSAEIYDTLCNVTKDREEKARKIAEASEVMLVIGDGGSSNSRELYEQCRCVCGAVFFIGSLADLEKNADIGKAIAGCSTVGLAASASTPDDIISGVYHYLMFADLLKSAKKEIESASREYFAELSAAAVDSPFVKNALKSLFEQNEGGKRIRGAMIKLGEMIASRGKSSSYLPVAVGYELFQTAILIHDDVIDQSDTRREKTTIHVESARQIKNTPGGVSDMSAEHFGISRALCIGDYGFFIAYQFLAKTNVDSTALCKLYQLYSQIFTTTCEGEIMDVILPIEKISAADSYEEYTRAVTQIYEYKTAWYTLTGPVILGAVCGGAGDDLIDLLTRITIPLGIAFQIKDDLLGLYSTEDALGKSVLADVRENKQTLLYGYAYKNADAAQRELLDRHYGRKDADENDLEAVRRLFEETGAKKYAEDEILRLSERGKELISGELIGGEHQAVLYGLISYLTGRKF